jgi:hypothetical protein
MTSLPPLRPDFDHHSPADEWRTDYPVADELSHVHPKPSAAFLQGLEQTLSAHIAAHQASKPLNEYIRLTDEPPRYQANGHLAYTNNPETISIWPSRSEGRRLRVRWVLLASVFLLILTGVFLFQDSPNRNSSNAVGSFANTSMASPSAQHDNKTPEIPAVSDQNPQPEAQIDVALDLDESLLSIQDLEMAQSAFIAGCDISRNMPHGPGMMANDEATPWLRPGNGRLNLRDCAPVFVHALPNPPNIPDMMMNPWLELGQVTVRVEVLSTDNQQLHIRANEETAAQVEIIRRSQMPYIIWPALPEVTNAALDWGQTMLSVPVSPNEPALTWQSGTLLSIEIDYSDCHHWEQNSLPDGLSCSSAPQPYLHQISNGRLLATMQIKETHPAEIGGFLTLTLPAPEARWLSWAVALDLPVHYQIEE